MKTSEQIIAFMFEQATEFAIARTSFELDRIRHLLESPLETIFLTALYCQLGLSLGYLVVVSAEPRDNDDELPWGGVHIRPQVAIGEYRVDFLIRHNLLDRGDLTPRIPIIVECDGHEFHERTKLQAERDRSRDRRLQAEGFTVFRFTGREIWRDALRCADEVIDQMMKLEDN